MLLAQDRKLVSERDNLEGKIGAAADEGKKAEED